MNNEMISNVDNNINNTIFKGRYGDFVIIGVKNDLRLIRFITPNDFGFYTIRCVNRASIIINDTSSILDPYKFNSCDGNACLGMPSFLGFKNLSDHPLYSKWSDMVQRCYMKSCREYQSYGAIGIITIYRWRCFEYFAQDAIYLPNYNEFICNPSEYALDKDALQQNVPIENRIYSPQTCMFIKKKYNLAELNFRKVTASNEFGYIGVSRRESDGAFCAHADRITIGVYKDPEAAAYAYNVYMLKKDPEYPRYLLNNVPELSAAELFSRKILHGRCKK